MKTNFKKIMLLLAVVATLSFFTSCSEVTEDTAIAGTWEDTYSTKIVISNTTYASYYADSLNYSGTVVSYKNDELNAGETSDADNYGYILVQLTESNSDYTPVGTCFVLRYKNIATADGTTTVYMSEGYGSETFTTSDEALAGMTAADNYFSYSQYTKSE
ncbi:MAG: hypothetical protein PQJ46_02790 [Spirochaetales bacterium]|nr:hypothetical protein [Spirochaetales bacterium]